MTPLLLALLSLIVFVAGGVAAWFYLSFLRLTSTELAPGVHAVFGGGGNSLVIRSGNQVILFDAKFPPFSHWLRSWVYRKTGCPVTVVVNSHYHFDHTQGNISYPQAQIIAQKDVPEFMLHNDRDWWQNNPGGIPPEADLVDVTRTLKVGEQEILLTSDTGHTRGDLWLCLADQGIVATGDLFSHRCYPFFDTDYGGASIPDIIASLRSLAERYPDAIFLPGHGPPGTASDVIRYSDYLEFLYDSVSCGIRDGLSEAAVVKSVDLSGWGLSVLPIFHYGVTWLTAKSNVRSAYRLLADSRD